MTPAINLSPESITPANNPCQGFSVFASVVDTGDTGEQLSPVTTTPAGDKFIAGDKNKDAMEVGSSQG
jgi:hypothetical protein